MRSRAFFRNIPKNSCVVSFHPSFSACAYSWGMRTNALNPIALAAGGALLVGVLLFSVAHAQVATSTTGSASAQNTSPSSASTATGAGSTSGGTAAAFVSPNVQSGNPGDTVLISGAGFLPDENVQISFGGQSSVVPAAGDGSFSAPMTVPQLPGGTVSVSAQGLQSGRVAAAAFSVGTNLGAATSTVNLASTTPLTDATAIQMLQSEVSSLQQEVSQLTAEVTVLQGAAGTQ